METYELQSLSRVVSTSKLAPDWLLKSEQPIRSQDSKLTQLLTMTQTHKFLPQEGVDGGGAIFFKEHGPISFVGMF